MLFMVIERFKTDALKRVYERFNERGRLMPDALTYVNSWITDDLSACYQVMSCDDPKLLDEWIANWSDLVDFEIVPVITSAEAKAKVLGQK